MRVLHIIERFWPALGGAEIHLGELSARLAGDGHEVTVATSDALDFELLFSPGRRRLAEREAWHRGMRILRFPVRHLPGCPLTYSAWRRLLWLLSEVRFPPVSVLSLLARFTPWMPGLWRWLRTSGERFDLVAGMSICFEAPLMAGLAFARRQGVPFVIYPLTHLGVGARPGADRVGSFYTMRHQVRLVRDSAAVIAQTPTERAFYVERGIRGERIAVVGPGVDPGHVLGGDGRRFRQRHGLCGPLVVSIGAMTQDKGTVQVVEGIRRLWRAGHEVELALAGAALTPFRRYLAGLPAEDRRRLHVLGSVSDEEKRDLLDAADIVAMPSRTDSFGIVYLEAWLYGKPVIGARAWGVNDVIAAGQDGLLVPFGDAEALAEAVISLLDQPERRRAMGRRGREKVYRCHTWELKYAAVRRLYEQLVGADGGD